MGAVCIGHAVLPLFGGTRDTPLSTQSLCYGHTVADMTAAAMTTP